MKAIPWTPRPYQLASLTWILEKPHCGLLLDPGLGKTSTVLAAIAYLKEQGLPHRTLVVAPLRVAKTVWPVEAKKWADFKDLWVQDLTNMDDYERARKLGLAYDIFVINPESMEKVLKLSDEFDILVIDESTKFKDTQTKRFKALRPLLHKFGRRIILTGTPAPNGLADLFGQMYVVDRGEALGKFITHFRQRYMYQGRDGFSWVMIPQAAGEIYERVKPKLLRLMAKDHLDMPELINNYIDVVLPPPVMKQYKEMERKFLLEIQDHTVVAFNSAALGVKCRQIANGFIYTNADEGPREAIPVHGQKLDALLELVDELQGRPLLLCYEFIEDARAIQTILPGAVDISKSKNVEKTIADFNEGKIPVLMGHPRSMGHGLNLQEKCYDICWFGITWDLELYQQAIARVWRQGQPNSYVVVHHLIAKDTLDWEVVKRLDGKDATQSRLNEALKTLARSIE